MAVTNGGASDTTEPAFGSSTGTDVSLRDYIDHVVSALDRRTAQRFDLTDKALDAALAAAKEAVDKAERAAEKRFHSVNEFRAQLSDQTTTFQRRDVADAETRAVLERLRILEDRLVQQQGRHQGATATIGYFLAVATLLISVVVVLANVLSG